MEQLEFLESLGLESVSNRTHINIQSLNDIVNKKFAKLNKTKAMGFIQILEREYSIDLSEWKREFNTFLETQKEGSQEELFVVAQKEEKKSKKTIIVILVFLALIYVIYQFFLASNSNTAADTTPTESTIKQEPVIEEAKKHLEALKDDTLELQGTDTNETNQSVINQENNSSIEDNDSNQVSEEKFDDMKIEEVKSDIAVPKSFFIQPRSKVWVGVIYLDDFSRKQFLTDENITLDGSREQLIVTGHAAMNMYMNAEKVDFESKTKVRFLYKEGVLTEISLDEFKIHNKGLGW